MNGNPGLNLIGIDFNSASPELRARFHLTQHQIGELYRRNVVPEETIIVSTCNRTEFYFWSDALVPLLDRLKAVYGENMTPQSFYCRTGADVVLHLLELAVGLKSMLIGENEILGQIESAWQMRNQISGPKLVLVGLFQRVVGAARRIRHRTNIGGYSSSLYTLVIKELKGQGGALAERSVLIMGNGEIGRKLARAFCYQKISTTILTRGIGSKQKAKPSELVAGVTTVFGYEHLETLLAQHDTIITATTAPHYILKPQHGRWLAGKVVIDLAFPRNVDPEIAHGCHCMWDLEYFQRLEAENRQEKANAIQAAQGQCRQAQPRIGAAFGSGLTRNSGELGLIL